MNRKLTKRLLIGGVVVGATDASYLLYRNIVKALSFQIKKSKILVPQEYEDMYIYYSSPS